MSDGFKKWLKVCAVLYGIYFLGGMIFRDLDLAIFMLAFLTGIILFLGFEIIKTVVLGIKKAVLKIRDVATTRYVIVFKF